MAQIEKDTEESLRAEFLDLLDRVMVYARRQREDAVERILRAANQAVSAHAADERSPLKRKVLKPRRARSGSVMKTVKKVLYNYQGGGLRPGAIADLAQQNHNATLKESSVRMALRSMAEKAQAVQHDGLWFSPDHVPKSGTGTAGGAGSDPSRQTAAYN